MPYLDLEQNAIVEGRRCLGCKNRLIHVKHHCKEDICDKRELVDWAVDGYDWTVKFSRWRPAEEFKTCVGLMIMMMEYNNAEFRKHFATCRGAQMLSAKLTREKEGLPKDEFEEFVVKRPRLQPQSPVQRFMETYKYST